MLEQMREAGPPAPLVFGSDVIPDVDRDDRQPVILVDDDVEAVVERRVYERNMQVHGLKGTLGWEVVVRPRYHATM